MSSLLKFDGYDEAIIGACMTWHGNMLVERVVYSGEKIREMLMSDGECTEEEADEYISINMVGGYVGDETPIVMWKATAEEIDEYS